MPSRCEIGTLPDTRWLGCLFGSIGRKRRPIEKIRKIFPSLSRRRASSRFGEAAGLARCTSFVLVQLLPSVLSIESETRPGEEFAVVKPVLSLMLLWGAILHSYSVHAQDSSSELKPMVVVCLSSQENAFKDVDQIGKLLNDDIYRTRFNAMVNLLLQTKDLKIDKLEGLDPARPLGFATVTDGSSAVPLYILPVSGDVEKLLESMKPLLGNFKKEENGTYSLDRGTFASFAKLEGDWLYLATSANYLEKTPDASQVFGDLPTRYDIGVRLHVQNVPEEYRTLLIDQIRITVEAAAQAQSGDSEALVSFRRELARVRSQLVERGLGESEQVTMGITIDGETSHGRAEVILKPQADSQFAKHLADLQNLKTRFGKLAVPGDATDVLLAMNMTGTLDKDSLDEYLGVVNSYRDLTMELIDKSQNVKTEEERLTLKELAGSLVDVMAATVEAGQLDVAVRMVGKGPSRNVVFAGKVSEGSKLQSLVEQIGDLAKSDPGFAAVKMNEADFAGIAIHSFKFKPEPASQEAAIAKIFGGELKLLVAVKDDNVWFALGPQAMDLIKKGMELSDAEVPPLRVTMRMSPLIQMGIQMMNQPQLSALGSMMSVQLSGADLATIEAQVTPDGELRVLIDADKGAVKLAGAMFGQMGPTILGMLRQQGGGGGLNFGRPR